MPLGNSRSAHEAVILWSVGSTAWRVPGGFVAASALGGIHAGFSIYWAAGGTLLAWSLGSDLVASFQGREWLLVPVGAVKFMAAVAPLALVLLDWPVRRATRSACWLGAVVLIVWGGLNTVVANLVLAGAIEPQAGFDRPGMIGHAWLWDPLFLAWGAAVAMGLVASRGRAHPPGELIAYSVLLNNPARTPQIARKPAVTETATTTHSTTE